MQLWRHSTPLGAIADWTKMKKKILLQNQIEEQEWNHWMTISNFVLDNVNQPEKKVTIKIRLFNIPWLQREWTRLPDKTTNIVRLKRILWNPKTPNRIGINL